MSPIASFLLIIVLLALVWGVQFELRRRTALNYYWSRDCAGRAWRRSFPDSPSDSIREFLYFVADSFGFERLHALKLAPDEPVIALYRAHYPDPSAPDSLELETLHRSLSERYGGSQFESLPDGVTFGELFSRATNR